MTADTLGLVDYIQEFNKENDTDIFIDLEKSHNFENLLGDFLYVKLNIPNMGNFESLNQKMRKLEAFLTKKLRKHVQNDGWSCGLVVTLEDN